MKGALRMAFDVNLISHCLHCKNARCQAACPIHTNIPKIIQLVQNGQVDEAQQRLFDHNFFSAVCALVCDHSRQCFGHCILNFKKDPVPFFQLEQALSLEYLNHYKPLVKSSNGKTIAIIGAGPAGMSLAFKLASNGYTLDLFDRHDHMGGVLRYGIPDFRLDKSIIDCYEQIIDDCGVHFYGQTNVTGDMVKTIRSTHDAIIFANGAWIARTLGQGDELPFVYSALDVLENHINFDPNQSIIVLGGGNVAMDAVRHCHRTSANTTLYYRKQIADMPANPDEIKAVQDEGIRIIELAAPVKFVDTPENGIVFAKGETLIDENGKKYTHMIENSEYFVPCDIAVSAISQQVDDTLWKAMDLTINKDGSTNDRKVYIIGDALLRPATVVEAVNSVNQILPYFNDPNHIGTKEDM